MFKGFIADVLYAFRNYDARDVATVVKRTLGDTYDPLGYGYARKAMAGFKCIFSDTCDTAWYGNFGEVETLEKQEITNAFYVFGESYGLETRAGEYALAKAGDAIRYSNMGKALAPREGLAAYACKLAVVLEDDTCKVTALHECIIVNGFNAFGNGYAFKAVTSPKCIFSYSHYLISVGRDRGDYQLGGVPLSLSADVAGAVAVRG